MEYQVILKAPADMTEADYRNGVNTLTEEKNGTQYGIWFDSLKEAKNECIKHKAYGIIDDDLLEYVWYNPHYKSNSIEELSRFLGRILLPH